MSIEIDLDSKVALVVGAGSGAGGDIAAQLARAGARVVLLGAPSDRVEDIAQRAVRNGSPTANVAMNINDGRSVQRALDHVRGQLGQPSILVNNVASGSNGAQAEPLSLEDARNITSETLLGTIYLMRATLPDLITTSGSIVNIVSDHARVGSASMDVVAATHAGVVAATVKVAREVAHSGVRANVVAVGAMITDQYARPNNLRTHAHEQARNHPLGRLGTPADVASAVLFMASPLSSWITGETLPVNGGYLMN